MKLLLEEKSNFLVKEILKSDEKTQILSEMKKIGIEKLPYSYSALEKFIDSETMDFHYNKHYKGYVKKLNQALSEKDYGDVELEKIIRGISKYNRTIRNNAGGAFNHALFWKMLSPKKQKLEGELLEKIIRDFGSYDEFVEKFERIAKKFFGSGWIWLILTKRNRLRIVVTSNQDNPLMNVIKRRGYPILGLDLWEHAFYLKYRNKRDDYISNFWNCVNWEFVSELYMSKQKKKNINEDVTPKKTHQVFECNDNLAGKYRLLFNQNKQIKWDFMRAIDSVFKEMFPKNWYEKGEYGNDKDEMRGLYDFRGTKGRAMINRINTHYYCYCILLSDINTVLSYLGEPIISILDKSPSEQLIQNQRLISQINKYKERIFNENSKTLKKMEGVLTGSFDSGEKRENYVVDKLKKVYGEDNVRKVGRFGSATDGTKGVDCEIKIDGKIYTAQIKPYNELKDNEDKIDFINCGGVGDYKTDLMILQNYNLGIYIFKNVDYEISRGDYTYNKKDLILKL